MDISKLFSGIGNTIGGAVQGAENAVGNLGHDFSQGVQNFQKQFNGPQSSPQAPVPPPNLSTPQLAGMQQPPVQLFVKPPQGQQSQGQQPMSFLGGPLSPTAQVQGQQAPQQPQVPPMPNVAQGQFQNPRPVAPPIPGAPQLPNLSGPTDDQGMLNSTLSVLESAAKGIAAKFLQQNLPYASQIQQALPQAAQQFAQGYNDPYNMTMNATSLPEYAGQLAGGYPGTDAIGEIPEETGQGLQLGRRALTALGTSLVPAVISKIGGQNPDPMSLALSATTGFFMGGGGGGNEPLSGEAQIPRISANDFNRYEKGDFSTPEGQQAVLQKIQEATQAQPDFHNVLDGTAEDVNGRAVSNVKTPTSIIGKVIDHRAGGDSKYGVDNVNDILRGSIEMPNESALQSTIDAAHQRLIDAGWDITNEENFFAKPGPNNYLGYHIDVSKSLPDGSTVKGEVQIHTPESYANARLTHPAYDMYGEQVPKSVKGQIQKLQAGLQKAPVQDVQAASQAKEQQDLPNTLSNVTTDHRQPANQTQAQASTVGIVGQLQSEHDQLQKNRLDPMTPPQTIQRQQARLATLKQQLQAAKQPIPVGTDRQTRLALKAERDQIQTDHDALQTQVKDATMKYTLKAKARNARIDKSSKVLQTRISEEQAKTQAKTIIQGRLSPKQEAFRTGTQAITATKPLTDSQKRAQGFPTFRSDEDLRNGDNPTYQRTGPLKSWIQQVIPSLIGRLKGSVDMRVRKLGFGLQDGMYWGQDGGQASSQRLADLRQGFTPEEDINSTQALENKAQPISARVANWVQAAHQESDKVFKMAKQVGISVQYIKDYFPHTHAKDTVENIANDAAMQRAVIRAGKARTLEEASNYLRRNQGRISAQELGALHQHREDLEGKHPYIQDPRVMENYLQAAYREIGHTSVFGPKMADAARILNGTKKVPGLQTDNPSEANAVKQAMQEAGAIYSDSTTPEEEAFKNVTGAIRNFNTVTTLTPGTTPLSHLPALGHAATRLGIGNVVKSLPTGAKALFGKYTAEQKANIQRLGTRDTAKLYGSNPSKAQVFYKLIGLEKTLNTLSPIVHDAAQRRMNWLEQNLTTPEAQRDIVKAGLPYNAIVKKGKFTQAQRYQYVNEALKDSSLELSGLDMPQLARNPLAKLAYQFTGPQQQALRRFTPFAANELARGNMGRKLGIAGGLAATAGLGIGTVGAKNLAANKPAQTPQNVVEQGLAEGWGVPGASQYVDASMYPEFDYTNTGNQTVDNAIAAGVNTVGGPLLGKAQNMQQIAQGYLPNASAAQSAQANRTALRNIPFAGPQIANTFAPANSYIGNRPSDVIGALAAGKPITHGTGNFAYQTNPTWQDIFRQNPDVTKQNTITQNVVQSENQILSRYNQSDQGTYKTAEAMLQAPYNGTGNPLDVKQAYGILGNNDNVRTIKTQIELSNAQLNGKQADPIWELGSTNPAEQKAILLYKSYSPADQTTWKKTPANAQMYNDYQAMESQYYAKNPQITQQATAEGISAPVPTASVSQLLNEYDAGKAAGHPNYALLDDPTVQSYFAGLDQFDNYINGLMGLPQTAGSTSGGSGYSTSSSGYDSYIQKELMYQAMAEARSRIQVPKVPLTTNFKNLQALQGKPLNFNLAAGGGKGQSIFATAQLGKNMAKLKRLNISSNLGKISMKGPSRQAQPSASPGRQTQLKMPAGNISSMT